MDFSHLPLSPAMLNHLLETGFEIPTPIQEKAIPVIAAGKDVLGIAKTGSGKTAAYVLPILEKIKTGTHARNRHIPVLVLVPTRELAMQVEDVFNNFCKAFTQRIKTLAVYGGVSINPQMINLQHVQVLVATPGRLLELAASKALHLADVEILVLDEADKMLNMGFRDEMHAIFSQLPAKRQNLLFSATLSKDVAGMQSLLLNDPEVIEIVEEDHFELISQLAYQVSEERKGPFLRYLIRTRELQQVLVFTSSVHRADAVADKLTKNGIEAAAFHSKKSQGARVQALKNFKAGKLRVLVATDLAARGIDIKFLPCVINYELPRSPKDYVHRIGRTGRAEASGEAIALITPEEAHHFGVIQKKMKKRVDMENTESINLHGY